MSRVLLVKRYSGEDDAGALDRQHALLAAWMSENGHVPADGPNGGWVEDETVSGSVNLDQRRSLGQWLKEPLLAKWDIMAVTEQDRVTRDDMHWWQFVGRLVEWGKRLVVLDDPMLDLSTPNGRMIAGIKATQAANYRLDVKRKQKNARIAFREQQRYAGGHWPYGYRAVPRGEGRDGWRLEIDPVSSEHVQEAVTRVIAGDSLRAISRDWADRGLPSARDHQALTTTPKPGESPRTPKGYKWTETSVKRILQNPAILGYASHNGELIRQDGIPVQWAEPIVTVDEFRKVQDIITARGARRVGIRSNRSPLLGVVFCGCGLPMHYQSDTGSSGKKYSYYRCSSSWKQGKTNCKVARSWPVIFVQDYLEDRFLFDVGDVEIEEKTFVPGSNHDEKIESLREAIDYLAGNLGTLPPGSRAAQAIIDKLSEHEKTLDELESSPTVPATYKYKRTGKTYGQHWEELNDWHERGAWLMRAGFRAEFRGSPSNPELDLIVPPDVKERLRDTAQ